MKKYILILSAALLALSACTSLKEEFEPVLTKEYAAPSRNEIKDIKVNTTIAELVSKYKTHGTPVEIRGDVVIGGRVTTTDQPGNYYKSFYIQDETGGIEIKMGQNSLYNDYKPGQMVYVKCGGLTIGEYGYGTRYDFSNKSHGSGNGMVNIGFYSPVPTSGSWYETSYLESKLMIDTHIFRGDIYDVREVEPVVLTENDLPGQSATQATNPNVGRLVTLKGLRYAKQIFCLLYLDSNKDKTSYTNRVFLSYTNGGEDHTHGITTWAMSKEKMTEYLQAGLWDSCKVGSGSNFTGKKLGDFKGDGTYPGVEKAAYSLSQYFTMGSTGEIQIRTSGFSKFCDKEIPAEVLSGQKTIDVTGVLTLYNGNIQIMVNDLSDIVVNDDPSPAGTI